MRTDPQATRSHVVKQRRDGFSWTQPVETPEPWNAVSRRWIPGLARPKIRFVCLGLEGDPYRTAGNDGVPLWV